MHIIHKAQNTEDDDNKYSWKNKQFKRKGKLLVGVDDKLKADCWAIFTVFPDGAF